MIAEQPQIAMQYWVNRFRQGCDWSAFPPDRPRSGLRSQSRLRKRTTIGSASWSQFVTSCASLNVRPSDAVLGLVEILLYRYTCTEAIEVVVQMGDVFPVAAELCASSTVREVVLKATGAVREARGIGAALKELHEWASEAGLPGERPLFRVVLSTTYLNDANESSAAGMAPFNRAESEVTLSLSKESDAVVVEAEFDGGLYRLETIERILLQIVFLIESFGQGLDSPLDRLPLGRARETETSIVGITAVAQHATGAQCIHHRVEQQAREAPDRVALVLAGNSRTELTYGQLNSRANRLARYLQAKGIGPDVLVGLYVERTPDLIVGMLAILKAGGAYLPIDLSYPAERVSFMLSDSEAPVVLVDSQTAKSLPQTEAIAIRIDDGAEWNSESSEDVVSNPAAENLAYCIFTSGSTGKPKGVLITHASVSRLFDSTDRFFHFGESDTWTFFHSSAFDFSVWEIWGALLYGGRLVIVPFADSRSPGRFYDLLASERVTVLNQTPSAFRQLVGVDESRVDQRLDNLRLVIFGGEALNLQSLAPWFAKYGDAKPQLVNMYGITETTVHVTYRPIKLSDLNEAPGSVIGVPIPDLQLYVLDAGLQPVPVGIPGEMFVGGAGVARGYLKRDALTAERFVQNPFSGKPGDRLYRSGDLARRLPDGDLEYMGRIDQQVKIRGFRVELGEIQSALTRQASVREAFVLAREGSDGEKALVAYIVPANGTIPAVDKLRRELLSALPAYMIPPHFVFLNQLPLTSNGKVDRAALPAVESRRAEMAQIFHEPQTDLEHRIAGVYREVLGLDKVGIDDDFFDLGGNSLRLAEAHSQLQRVLRRNFSAADLFVHTTVRELAKSFNRPGPETGAMSEIVSRAQLQREAMSRSRNWRR